jgi:hypothetical protein
MPASTYREANNADAKILSATCVELANEATELYAKTALLESAAEFHESAERLEHRMHILHLDFR